MCSLPNASQARPEEAVFYFMKLAAGSHKEVPHALSATQRTTPAGATLRLGGIGALQALQPVLTSPERANDASLNPVYSYTLPLPATALSSRTYNALLKSRIITIQQLCALKLNDLKWLRNCGKKAVAEVTAYRALLGVPIK